MRFLSGGSGISPTSKRSADCRMRCWHFIPPLPVLLPQQCFLPLLIISPRYRHTRSTLRDNRFHRRRWDNSPICVAAAKTRVFVRVYTVTLNRKCRHPYFYRHPPQTKVNRRFQNFGCRHGQQFLPTAGFRFYCHPTGHKRVPVFLSHDFCAY